MKKKAGASAGSRPPISRARLPSTSATATITVRPMPSDSMIWAVGAPGR